VKGSLKREEIKTEGHRQKRTDAKKKGRGEKDGKGD